MSVKSLLHWFCECLKKFKRLICFAIIGVIACMGIALAIGKTYQSWDKDKERGAIAIQDGEFGEDYSVPEYLDQGWSESDSLWFYNTTQGSDLIPYDFYMELKLADSDIKFKSDKVYDEYRYLPQKATFFNKDALAVGFVKDVYKGKEYIGYTCAACHTGQVNYQGKAIRIDGGPAMADMVGYLRMLEKSMKQTLNDEARKKEFVEAVIARGKDYDDEETIVEDLKKWTGIIQNYNVINRSHLDYGYARLDAFGRIYNRVLQHVVNKEQAKTAMLLTTNAKGEPILTEEQVDIVLAPADATIIGNEEFSRIINRLLTGEKGLPKLGVRDVLRIRNSLFNEPNAPVSYPFLWDIVQSDYVQWNGLAANAGVGPLGRNAGEVIGVFGTLDWKAEDAGFNLGAYLSGQKNKRKKVHFESSIDKTNLERLERHLKSLKSPVWPEHILGKLDQDRMKRGRLIYAQYCESCHEIVDRENWDRIVVAQMASLKHIGTDPTMAENSVNYAGYSGNFNYTYQGTDVGDFIPADKTPVAVILTAATKGVVATPDADKWFLRRWLDWLYVLFASFSDNSIKASIKQGTYEPDTTASPFQSLLSYKARSLNGIWATAPYLHNGSVPTLYDLLLPAKREGDPEDGEYRPDEFLVGSREFDPYKVGFKSEGYDGFRYLTMLNETEERRGNSNRGHEYAAGRSAQPNGEVLKALDPEQRLDLLEYLKSL